MSTISFDVLLGPAEYPVDRLEYASLETPAYIEDFAWNPASPVMYDPVYDPIEYASLEMPSRTEDWDPVDAARPPFRDTSRTGEDFKLQTSKINLDKADLKSHSKLQTSKIKLDKADLKSHNSSSNFQNASFPKNDSKINLRNVGSSKDDLNINLQNTNNKANLKSHDSSSKLQSRCSSKNDSSSNLQCTDKNDLTCRVLKRVVKNKLADMDVLVQMNRIMCTFSVNKDNYFRVNVVSVVFFKPHKNNLMIKLWYSKE